MFQDSNFNGDIRKHTVKLSDGTQYEAWDTSKVVNMNNMFNSAINFNQNILNWKSNDDLQSGNMFAGAQAFLEKYYRTEDSDSTYKHNGPVNLWAVIPANTSKLVIDKSFQVNPTEMFKTDPVKPTEMFKTDPVKPTEKLQTYPVKPTEKLQTYPVKPTEKLQTYPVKPTEKLQTYPVKPTEKLQTYPVKPTEKLQTYPVNNQIKPTEKLQTYPVKPTEMFKTDPVNPKGTTKSLEEFVSGNLNNVPSGVDYSNGAPF